MFSLCKRGNTVRKDIEEALKKFEVGTFGNKSRIEQLAQNLSEFEDVIYIAPTNAKITTAGTSKVEKLPGIFVLTSQRILFGYTIGFSHALLTSDLSEIKMVTCRGNGLTGGHVEVHTYAKTIDILVKYKKEIIQNIQFAFDNTLAKYKQNIAQSHFPPGDDILAKIQKLADLKDKGILSEYEFTTKKSELLARL